MTTSTLLSVIGSAVGLMKPRTKVADGPETGRSSCPIDDTV